MLQHSEDTQLDKCQQRRQDPKGFCTPVNYGFKLWLFMMKFLDRVEPSPADPKWFQDLHITSGTITLM